MRQTHNTFCRICEALCGLEVAVDDGVIAEIRADASHVATSGFACPKGLKQHIMYASPDRLRRPLKRVGNDWQCIGWDQALAEIGAKVRGITASRSADAIAMYVGTAAGFGVLHPIFAQGFMTGLGSASMYSSATQDCANKFAVAHHVYGFPFTQPFPDLDHCECLVIAGANPVVSKWSFLQVSNPARRLKQIEARGAKLYFVDPRRTESAKVAGEHVFIRPNTDVFFFLSFLHELIATGGVDRERVAEHMTGLAELERLVEPWTPERSERVTRVAAGRLREIVAAYSNARGAALYCSTGVNMTSGGTLAFWLQELINAVSGNLDRRGGTLVGRGVIDFARFGKKKGLLMRENKSRIGGFRSVNDTFPGGILADEILTPGRGQVRGLFVTGGNPLLSMANGGRLLEAFADLELLVVTDIYLNETASMADYVLPATSPMERPDLPFIFPLMLGLQSRPYLQATDRVVAPDAEQRDEATVYLQLARACGVGLFGSKMAQALLEVAMRVYGLGRRGQQPALPQRLLLSLLLRVTGQGSFAELARHRHGRLRPAHTSDDFLGKRVVTDDGRVHLAPAVLLEAAASLEDHFARELAESDGLKLITRRAVTSHNTWTHNIEEFVRADRTTNYLYMHPQDAERMRLAAGDLADVSTSAGAVRVPVRLLADLMPGTVALPHGWGHQHAEGLSVASRTTGVNANLLATDGPDGLEPVSGMAHLTGLSVNVRPAAAAQDGSNWSGIGAAEADGAGSATGLSLERVILATRR